mgnify:CR=1 FL=1
MRQFYLDKAGKEVATHSIVCCVSVAQPRICPKMLCGYEQLPERPIQYKSIEDTQLPLS